MGIPTKLSESYVGQLVERVAELEAENKRLREALRPLVESWSHLELSPGPGQYELFIEADYIYAAVKAMEESDGNQQGS